jgi:methionyl-tRNA formyltransferase
MLHTLSTPIEPNETYGELHDRLTELGAQAIIQALTLIEAGVARPIAQDDSRATYARKIERGMARLDFTGTADGVSRITRAFDPRPGAFTTLRGSEIKLFGASLVGDGTDDALDGPARSSPPGTVRYVDADGLLVRCGTGGVRFCEIQPSGKPRMSAQAWVNGRGIGIGDRFDAPAAPDYLSAHDAGGRI